MILTDRFNELVFRFWSRRFACETLDLDRPHTLFYADAELKSKERAVIYHIGNMCVLRITPELLEATDLKSHSLWNRETITLDSLRAVLKDKWQVELKSTLLDWFLDADDHQSHLPPDSFTAQRVDGVKEDAVLRDLYASVTEQDLDEAEIYVDEPDPVIFGLFNGDKMIAYTSHRYWEDLICDIGVLVHPQFRNLGLGKAVVSALCEWCIENEKIPMYRVFDDHLHSVRIPEALGFQKLITISSISIEEKKE